MCPFMTPPPYGYWEKPIGMGVKKKDLVKGRKGSSIRKKKSFQLNSNSRPNFLNTPLSTFDLLNYVKHLGIKYFKGVFSRDNLPNRISKECGIINLDDQTGR